MLEIIPRVPQNELEYATVVSDRVVEFSVDQAAGAFPAPDQIVLAAASD